VPRDRATAAATPLEQEVRRIALQVVEERTRDLVGWVPSPFPTKTTRRLAREGKLSPSRIGRVFYVRRAELDAFMDAERFREAREAERLREAREVAVLNDAASDIDPEIVALFAAPRRAVGR
jgi:hypothetical protein